MYDDLGDLYQELILDHNSSPHNFGELANANHKACGNNRLCGDRLTLFVQVDQSVVADVKFNGEGCAISKAAASMMTDAIKGKTLSEVEKIFNQYHALLTDDENDSNNMELLGKLVAFKGVKQFPIRVKCATLAWHTLNAALKDDPQDVSTE